MDIIYSVYEIILKKILKISLIWLLMNICKWELKVCSYKYKLLLYAIKWEGIYWGGHSKSLGWHFPVNSFLLIILKFSIIIIFFFLVFKKLTIFIHNMKF